MKKCRASSRRAVLAVNGPVGPCLAMRRRGRRATSSGVGAGGGLPSEAGGLALTGGEQDNHAGSAAATKRPRTRMQGTIQGLNAKANLLIRARESPRDRSVAAQVNDVAARHGFYQTLSRTRQSFVAS